jgi:hypothetical protein
VDGPREAIWTDILFGGAAPTPLHIPYLWIANPLLSQPDKALTTATVSTSGGATVTLTDTASAAAFGTNKFDASLNSPLSSDALALATYIITYYATDPSTVERQRLVGVRFILNARTPTECWTILSGARGDRFSIIGAPAFWPPGMSEQVIEGVAHSSDGESRFVDWVTQPVIGATYGAAGPWFGSDDSITDGTDLAPF